MSNNNSNNNNNNNTGSSAPGNTGTRLLNITSKEIHGSGYLSSPTDAQESTSYGGGGGGGGPESPNSTIPSTWTTTSPPTYPQPPVVSTSIGSNGGGPTSAGSLSSPVHLAPSQKPKRDKNPFGGISASSFLESLPAPNMKLYPGSKKASKSHGDMLNAGNSSLSGDSHKSKKSGGGGPLSSINTRKQQLSPAGHHSIERSYSSSTSNISSPMTPDHKGHITTATHHYMSPPTLSRNHHSSLDAKVMAKEMSQGHATEDVWQALCIKVLTLFNGQGLTGAIEDLNDLVRRCMVTRNAFALCDEINELLKNGMLTLNAKLGDVPDEKLVSRLVEVWSFFFGTVLPYFEGVFLPLQIDLKSYHARNITRKNMGGAGIGGGGSFSGIGGPGSIGTAAGSVVGPGVSALGALGGVSMGLESSMAVPSPKMSLSHDQEPMDDSEPENVRTTALTSFRDLVILPMVDRLGDVFAKLFMDFDASIPVTDTASRMLQMTSVLTSIQSGDAQQLLMEQVSNRLRKSWMQFTRHRNRGGFAGFEKNSSHRYPAPPSVVSKPATSTTASASSASSATSASSVSRSTSMSSPGPALPGRDPTRRMAHEIMEDAGTKLTESTERTIAAIERSSIVKDYLGPVATYSKQKYRQLPLTVRYTVASFGLLSAIPVACFLGFMAVVTTGCLIVGGLGLTVVEGGFAMFASVFLLPALGVAVLVSGGLGLTAWTGIMTYRAAAFMTDKMFGSGTKESVERKVERKVEQGKAAVREQTQIEMMDAMANMDSMEEEKEQSTTRTSEGYNPLFDYDEEEEDALGAPQISVLRPKGFQNPMNLDMLDLPMDISAAEIPKPQTKLVSGTRYLSYMAYAGLTNQVWGWQKKFMALEKAAYMAKRLNRTLIIPPIISNSHDTHNSNQRWSDYFDLERFTATTGIPVVEWDDVRPLTKEQAYIGRQQAKLRRRSYGLWERLAEDLTCQVIYGFGASERLHTTEMTFLRQFLFRPTFVPPPPRVPGTIVYERTAIGVKDNSNMQDIVTMDDLVDRYKGQEDTQLLFLSHTFKLKDPIGDRTWQEAGQHLHFQRRVNEYAARLLRHRMPELGHQGRYIAIHIRRGDIWQKCRSATPEAMMACIPPLGHYAEAVETARALAQEKRLPVIVATDSQSVEDHQTIARLGWRRLNHELYITEQELGVFGAAMVDAVILANADYFIGTEKSTMTKVAAQRQMSWHQRNTIYPRTQPSWVPAP
ncbi:hypothetical protein BGZ94_001573 [Podila epigama]|nr:hypothetical protein BGZ94_001573 [Podila epigama]